MSDLIELVRGASDAAKLWGHQVEAIIIGEAADQLEAQQAEIARLRKLVLSAFEEGFRIGAWRGDFKAEVEWKESDSCAALEQKP